MTLPLFNMIFHEQNHEITTMFYNVFKSFLLGNDTQIKKAFQPCVYLLSWSLRSFFTSCSCFGMFSTFLSVGFFLYSYLAPTCLTRPATTLDAVLPVMCTKQIALKGIMEDYHHFFIVAFYCLHENSFASPKRLLFMTRRETFMIFLLADDFISLVMRNTLFR